MYTTLRAMAMALALCIPLAHGAADEIDERVDQILSETIHAGERAQTPIVLLGVFHFQDAGLDTFKPQHEIDVKSPERQAEIQDIVDRLAAYGFTKIAVERKWQAAESLQAEYAAYLKGEFELPSNEIYQLGFRLAKQLGHAQVYPVDAPGRGLEPIVDPREYAKDHGLTRQLRQPYSAGFFNLGRRMDEIKMEHSLREHLLVMNHPKMMVARHGNYMQKDLAVGQQDEYPKADGFVTTWYNRNLRIFGNIHRITEDDDKILAIFGAGHVPLLKHFADSSAEFEVVEVGDVLD